MLSVMPPRLSKQMIDLREIKIYYVGDQRDLFEARQFFSSNKKVQYLWSLFLSLSIQTIVPFFCHKI